MTSAVGCRKGLFVTPTGEDYRNLLCVYITTDTTLGTAAEGLMVDND
jgi:hypothetical protein